MKKVLMALIITAFAYHGAEAQTKETTVKCVTTTKTIPNKAVAKKTAAKPKRTVKTSQKVNSSVTACKMVPMQVCTIEPDRMHVKCYTTTDGVDQKQTGEATYYGPTGPMPGEPVNFDVKTIVVSGKKTGAYCKRNAADDATICYKPGMLLVRDENGYYSYVEEVPQDRMSAK